MKGPLDKFILENRDEFDADIPDSRVWEKIKKEMDPSRKDHTPVRSLPFKRWMAAAAVIMLLSLTTVLYYTLNRSGRQKETIAQGNTGIVDSVSHLQVTMQPEDSSSLSAKNTEPGRQKINQNGKAQADPGDKLLPENEGSKEMYYYAKLIELKHEELKTLEKDEPLLYRQFSGDVQKLDSVYHALKTQLPNNSNREQVIEAMISNLQLQIGLLNKQLDIIKQIKHSKKSAYEKAYKSV